jgi:hypothetical protein
MNPQHKKQIHHRSDPDIISTELKDSSQETQKYTNKEEARSQAQSLEVDNTNMNIVITRANEKQQKDINKALQTNQKQSTTQDINQETKKLTINILVNNMAGMGLRTGKFENILQWLEDNRADIYLGQEVNTSKRHKIVQKYLRSPSFAGKHIVLSETKWNFETVRKPGGTMCISNQTTRSRIQTTITDSMGRWAGNVYQFKHGTSIAILSIYQVTKKKDKGTTTIAAQQEAMLQEAKRNITPRQAFHEDLVSIINTLRDQNIEIIVSGDFNSYNRKKGILLDLEVQCGLVNVCNEENTPTTYKQGTKCLDHTYVSPDILPAITELTYMDYPIEFYTDHRPIKLSIDMTNLQQSLNPIIRSPIRRIYSKDHKNVRLYITSKVKMLQHNNIESRIKRLEQDLDKSSGNIQQDTNKHNQQINELNSIDKILTRISLQAENMIKKRRRQMASPKCRAKQNEYTEIRYNLQRAKTQHDKAQIKYLKHRRRKIVEEIKDLIKNAPSRKLEEVQVQIDALHQKQGSWKKLKQSYHSKLQKLKTSHIFKTLKQATGRDHQDNLPVVNIRQNGVNIAVTDPDKIAEALLLQNKSHFAQAKGCLLSNEIHANVSTIQELKSQKFPPESYESKFQAIIDKMEVNPIPIDITIEQWRRKFKKWRESTSTSPSGIHLGHYKSLIEEIYDKNEDQFVQDPGMTADQEWILTLHLRVVNMALKTEQSLIRWQRANNICIPKKKDCRDVDSFRNIHIYECDLNAMLSIKWNEALSQAEKSNIIHSSQFGGRTKHSSQMPILLEIIQQDIARTTRNEYSQINYDAKACYDRILPTIAAIVSQAHGVPKTVTKTHLHLLNKINYFVTIIGAEDKWKFNNTKDDPVYGTGQGSGNSPHIWTFLSSILFKILENEATGATYKDISKKSEAKIINTAFVDDVNTHHRKSENLKIKETMWKDYTHWKNILEMSGGKLAPQKCNFYHLGWDFLDSGKPVMVNRVHQKDEINENPDSIQQVNIEDSHKTLGHRISPQYPGKHKIAQLTEVDYKFQSILKTSNLQKNEVHVLYRSIYIPTIRYILQSSSLKREELHQATQGARQMFISKMGYNRNTSCSVIFGSKSLGGLGFQDPYVEQGLLNVQAMINALTDKSMIGQITRIAFENWQWHVGIGQEVLEYNDYQLIYDESAWFKATKEFMREHNIQIRIKQERFPRLRENDRYIMEVALTMKLNNRQLKLLNRCRLFLGVITIADITNEQGTHILPTATRKIRALQMVSEKTPTVIQTKPSKDAWKLWNNFTEYITVPKQLRLKKALGKWIVNRSQIRRKYLYYRTEDTIFHTKNDEILCWKEHSIKNWNPTRKQYSQTAIQIPESAIPCLTSYLGWAYTKYERQSNNTQEAQVLHHPIEGTIVSDASVLQGKATWAFILRTPGSEDIAKSGKIHEKGISSYRAELYGASKAIQETKKYTIGTKWKYYCDNQSVVNILNKIRENKVGYQESDSDILMTCQENMPINIQIQHVKGHQANEESDNLPTEVNLNIRADKLANQQQTSIPSTQEPEDHTVYTLMKGRTITSKPIATMRYKIAKTRLKNYMKEKLKGHEEKVEWKVFEASIEKFKRLPTSLIKLIHNVTPTQAHMFKLKLTNCNKCPCCKEETETIHHIIICKEREMDGFQLFQSIVKEKIKKSHISEKLMKQVYTTIITSTNQIEGFTSQEQQMIGWHKLLQGYFSSEWLAFFENLPGDIPGSTYVENIIIAIWKTWHQAWSIRNASIDETARYSQQMIRDNLICDLEVIYTNRRWLSHRTSATLEANLQQHLKHTQSNIIHWLEMHKQKCKEEINKRDPNQWEKTRKEIISREMEKFNDPN